MHAIDRTHSAYAQYIYRIEKAVTAWHSLFYSITSHSNSLFYAITSHSNSLLYAITSHSNMSL